MIKYFKPTAWYLYAFLFLITATLGNQGQTVFLYLAFSVGILEIITCDIKNNFCFSLFLIPNIRILDNAGISFAVNILIVLPFLKYLLVTGKIQSKVLCCAIVLGLLEVMHCLVYDTWKDFFPLLCWLLAFMYSMTVFTSKNFKIFTYDLYISFFAGILTSSTAYFVSHIDLLTHLFVYIRNGYRFEAYGNDPNYFSLYICLAISLLFMIKDKNYSYYIMLGILLFIGLLTGSKMSFLLMSFILLYVFFAQGMRTGKEAKFIRTSIVMLGIGILSISKHLVVFIENLIKRGGISNYSFDVGKLTTGRSDLFYDYTCYFVTHLTTFLIGNGMGYAGIMGIHYHVAHNTYLDIALSWGIIGILVLLACLYCLIKTADIHFKKPVLYYLPLISVLLNFMDLSCFNATMFWFIVVTVLLPFKIKRDYMEIKNETFN